MKKRKLFAGGLVAIILLVVAIYFITTNKIPVSDGLSDVNIYFVSNTTGILEPEKHNLILPESRAEIVRTVFNEYLNGPINTGLSLPDTELKNYTALVYPVNGNENMAKINFTDSYYNLSESKRLLCISGLVYTLTELGFLNNVYFYVNDVPVKNYMGDEVERFNRNNVLNNPSFEPEKSDRQLVVLYFTDTRHKYLMPEERSIEIKQSQTTEYQIVEQLIQGPFDSGLMPTVPSETKIKDIKTEEGICYVNLSSDFVNKHIGNTADEIMTIYSIVNSLTELQSVNRVQFLIEGEKINKFKGHIDLSKTFERDIHLIKSEDEG